MGLLACSVAATVLAACGGGGSSTPIPPPTPPPPVTSPIAPGATVPAQGYSGGTFTFSFGPGVPAGETFTVGPLAKPQPPSCPPNAPCATILPLGPVDALAITVGPAALPLSAITNVALSGFTLSQASFTLVDTTVDEGTTWFSSTPAGGPLVETHALPDESSAIVTLQPNRRYVLSLFSIASFDKPPGAAFVPPGGTLATTIPQTGDILVVAFNSAIAIPAKEWIEFYPAPSNPTPPTTVDAISFDTYPTAMPSSVIAGVMLVTPRSYSGMRLEAGITGFGTESALATAVPFALAPPGTPQNPPAITYQTGPDYGTSLATINPARSYILSVRTY